MQTLVGFFTGSSAGYFLASLFAGEEAGREGIINSLIFTFGDWQLHLHHWLFSLFFLAFLFLFIKKRYRLPTLIFMMLVGFFVGLVLQGVIVYDDWYRVLYKI